MKKHLQNEHISEDNESNCSKEELEARLNELRNAVKMSKKQLRAVRDEIQQAEEDIEQSTVHRDRLQPLQTETGELGAALRELDRVRQQQADLSHQLKEQTAANHSSLESMERKQKAMEKDMRREMDVLEKRQVSLWDQKKAVSLQCSKIRESLEETEGLCQAVEEKMNSDTQKRGSNHSQKKEDLLLEAYVANLGIPATLGKAGIARRNAKTVK
nr:PREDICTED: GRIP and coiled-coil domain-containing protein 2-like [Lepisosteus oculatus]